MPTVSGKQRLCKCQVNRFKSFEGMNGHPWYERYDDIADIVAHNIDKRYSHFLAQPIPDEEEIIWFTEPYSEKPRRLSELGGAEHEKYSRIKDESVAHYRDAIAKLESRGQKNEALALRSTISDISDEFVYCYDGKTVLGIWGMKPRDEYRQALGIVTNNDFEAPKRKTKPNNPNTYSNDDPDKLYNTPDNPHTRTEPQDEESEDEKPQDEDTLDKEPHDDESREEESKEDEEKPQDEESQKEEHKEDNLYDVDFRPTDGGHLQGTTHYRKPFGDYVNPNEVPIPMPDKGYEFIGWDIQPEGYCIKGDTLFTARFRKKDDNDNNDNNNHIISDDGRNDNDDGRNDNDDGGDGNDDGGDGNDDGGDGNGDGGDGDGDTVIVDDSDDNRHKGNWLTALLNWLLLLLLLGLIFMLIWCLLLGRCHMNLCGGGCNCVDTVDIVDIVDTVDTVDIDPKPKPLPDPEPNPPIYIDTSCNSSVSTGGDEGFLGTFDMKQPSGTFRFTFNTYNLPDLVTIYDGTGTNGKKIFSNKNNTSTRGSVSTMVHFNQQTITVQVISLQPPGTKWDFIVYCPRNCPQNHSNI